MAQTDIRHMRHALSFLRPGGRLVAIMAASVLYRQNRLTQEFREAVQTRGTPELLTSGSFKASGTDVETALIVMDAGPELHPDFLVTSPSWEASTHRPGAAW